MTAFEEAAPVPAHVTELPPAPVHPALAQLCGSMPMVGGAASRDWIVPRIQHLSVERVQKVLHCSSREAQAALRGETSLAALALLIMGAGYSLADAHRGA